MPMVSRIAGQGTSAIGLTYTILYEDVAHPSSQVLNSPLSPLIKHINIIELNICLTFFHN